MSTERKEMKLTTGQKAVLIITATPMAVVGVAGAVATFFNMDRLLHSKAAAMGMVAAGEGATLIAALVALSVTLMGQHTPLVARAAMWLLPLVASGAGLLLADTADEKVFMVVTPLAMTVSGEGVAFVARRIVAHTTGVDIEQQRRSGLLLWHANRAANGKGKARERSEKAVWRLSRQFAATDSELAVNLSRIQRDRVSDGAEANLAAVLSGVVLKRVDELPQALSEPVEEGPFPELPPEPSKAVSAELAPVQRDAQAETHAWVQQVLNEATEPVRQEEAASLMTVAEVAKAKGVSHATVRSWKHRGRLNAWDTGDGSLMFHRSDVDALKTS